MEQKNINILMILIIVILCIAVCDLYYKCNNHVEGLTSLSNESVQNISSMYNEGTLTVSNLTVTGSANIQQNLKVNGTSNLGQWNIRNDRLGIPGSGDIQLATDKWLRLYDYDGTTYSGTPGTGGFAGKNLWADEGNAYCQNMRVAHLNDRNIGDVYGSIDDIRNNAVRKDRHCGIQSSRTGYLSDRGGWVGRPSNPGDWEVMRFDELGF